MHQNQVWCFLFSKWIFKKKNNVDRHNDTFKARLMEKGYHQRQGVDYDETFSQIGMIKSIKIFLTITAYYDYKVYKMNIKNIFLNRNLVEEVYMMQTEGYTSKQFSKKVCIF